MSLTKYMIVASFVVSTAWIAGPSHAGSDKAKKLPANNQGGGQPKNAEHGSCMGANCGGTTGQSGTNSNTMGTGLLIGPKGH